jgi:hypothetical protein
MKKLQAYLVIGIVHLMHIFFILGCLLGIIAAKHIIASIYFLIVGIVWGYMYVRVEEAPPIVWANNILKGEPKL